MSVIVSWAPLHGQAQTSNIHALGFTIGSYHRKSVLMMQTHFTGNNMEAPLVGENVNRSQTKENGLFLDIGLDAAVTFSMMNQLDKDRLESCCITFGTNKVSLMPGTKIRNKETFDRDIGQKVGHVIYDAEKYVDIVLVDANSGDDALSFKLMEQADLIIINLTQRKHVIERFLKDYGERFSNNKKVFYLFGDYDDNSACNINNLRRKYSAFLGSGNSGVIPYCTKYLDAQNESRVEDFMKKGLKNKKEGQSETIVMKIKAVSRHGRYYPDETEYFFHRTKLSVDKILKMTGISIRRNRQENRL